jgi:hypothetical protein
MLVPMLRSGGDEIEATARARAGKRSVISRLRTMSSRMVVLPTQSSPL